MLLLELKLEDHEFVSIFIGVIFIDDSDEESKSVLLQYLGVLLEEKQLFVAFGLAADLIEEENEIGSCIFFAVEDIFFAEGAIVQFHEFIPPFSAVLFPV